MVTVFQLFLAMNILIIPICSILCGDSTNPTISLDCGPATNLNCSGSQQCKNDNLYCLDMNPCNVLCYSPIDWSFGRGACIDTIIHAINEVNLNFVCSTPATCDEATIIGGPGSNITIQCTDNGCGYAGIKVYGTNISNLHMNCTFSDSTEGACDGSIIQIVNGGDVILECNEDGDCANLYLYASTAHSVNVYCMKSSSCSNINIICGTGSCNLLCKFTDSCTNAQVDATSAHSFLCTSDSDGCNQPSIPISFTLDPTITPTTLAPTYYPSNLPTIYTLPICVDYNKTYNSHDGYDIVFDDKPNININTMHNTTGANNIMYYTSNDLEYYGNHIHCNQSQNNESNICFIKCLLKGSCTELSIIPHQYLSELIIECHSEYSCNYGILNTNSDVLIMNTSLLCNASYSCQYFDIISDINSPNDIDTALTIYCADVLSCNYMSLNITTVNECNINEWQYTVTINCFMDNSCDNLMITAHECININVNMYRYSANVHIFYNEPENINLICYKTTEHRYIKYDTDDIINENDMILLSQKEYKSSYLPCNSVNVICKQNECKYDYQLIYSSFNVSQLIKTRHNDISSCFWVELNDIFNIRCVGNCGDNQTYYNYNISMTFTLSFNNDSLDECYYYFGTPNETLNTLNNINHIFEYLLKIKDIINSIPISPDTILINETNQIQSYLHCDDTNYSTLLTTNFTIKTLNSDTNEINSLFIQSSSFYNVSVSLLNEYFGTEIIFAYKVDINVILNALPYEWSWWIYVIISISILILLLSIFVYIYQKRKIFKNALYVSNPMVISIAIGTYNSANKENVENIGGEVGNLPVELDVMSIKIFCDTFHYKIYPVVDNIDAINTEWTESELTTFLKQKADDLEDNLTSTSNSINKYDCLLVIVSAHGLLDNIITSDYQMIDKSAIHGIFSHYHAHSRKIPRIFIFDSCNGDEDKSSNLVSRYRNKHKEMNKHVAVSDIPEIEKKNQKSLWRQDQNNPDYNLTVIEAANPGFQAKMDSEDGSYLISYFVHRLKDNINNNKKEFLHDTFTKIQNKLHDLGKQQMITTLNNQSKYVIFKKSNVKDTFSDDKLNDVENNKVELVHS